jgi:hypothetical protein
MNSIFGTTRMPLVIASVLLIVAAACGEASGSEDRGSAQATGLAAVESGSPEDVVTPEGAVSVAAGDQDGAPSFDPSAPGDGQEGEEVEWLEYEDSDLGFTISYPATLVPSSVDVGELDTSALAVIEFRDLTSGELEPPFISIWVAENTQISLEGWIAELAATGSSWQRQDITLDGVDAVQMCSSTFIAPGCHVFVASGELVYQLVPLGEYGDQMLATFEFVA